MFAMFDFSKNYWFYFEPSVYCITKKNKSLLYNTSNGAKIVVRSRSINNLIKDIYKKENYGCIFLDGIMLRNKLIRSFILKVVETQIGTIICVDNYDKKPIKPRPVFRLDCDIERNTSRGDEYSGKNIFDNLMVINLYVNSVCNTGCVGCGTYYKQVTCCFASPVELVNFSEIQIDNFISQIEHSSVRIVNILGGNIFNYLHLNALIKRITEIGIEVKIWTHYSHIQDNPMHLVEAGLNILVPSSDYLMNLARVAVDIKYSRATFHFFVESEIDVDKAEQFISNYQVVSFQLHPIYNGINLPFFEKNVFIENQDIFHKTFSYREIFAHQKLNTNYFGIFNIFPNGDVMADVNSKVIGNLKNTSILELVHKELQQNTAWRRLRDLPPCSSCLYQFICPSPSSYESSIGRSNLCHVME